MPTLRKINIVNKNNKRMSRLNSKHNFVQFVILKTAQNDTSSYFRSSKTR